MQAKFLETYERMWIDRHGPNADGFYHLGDNPEQRFCASSKIMSLRTGMGPVWARSLDRWLLKRELLRGMGWEVVNSPEASQHLYQHVFDPSFSYGKLLGTLYVIIFLSLNNKCLRAKHVENYTCFSLNN